MPPKGGASERRGSEARERGAAGARRRFFAAFLLGVARSGADVASLLILSRARAPTVPTRVLDFGPS
jgi:hypothetical protein